MSTPLCEDPHAPTISLPNRAHPAKRKAGSIVTISSSATRRPHPGSVIPYAAAKAGIKIMTPDLVAQVGPYRIRANHIAPETILTERKKQRIPDPQKHALRDQHPISSLGTPEDVARAALFLASDAADWITGIVLDVAGESTMVGPVSVGCHAATTGMMPSHSIRQRRWPT
jgi:3-oxoacyl-[acyl-carrier protein] reductase